MRIEQESEDRTRSVLDPIHGLIRLTPTEMRVVDDRLFQRLRNIKQNGLLYYVFPGATHTRFEHSLGALYVAHGMLNSLSLNSEVGLSKRNVRSIESAAPGEAAAFPASHSREWNFLYKVTRLAALVHDLGHGPLSHTFDSFAPKRSALATILESDALEAIKPLHELMRDWGIDRSKSLDDPKNRRVPHEVMSCIFFTKIWHDMGEDPDIACAVCAAILGQDGEQSAPALLNDSWARAWVPLVHDIVASAPADADRMDYMERDSRAIGVTYGLFDRNRVLKSLLCYRADAGNLSTYRLGIKHSGLPAIENLMQARYELFVQIYYHKTNRAIARMLTAISAVAEEQMDIFGQEPTLDSWVEQYLTLTDERFLRLLLGGEVISTPEAIRDIAESIQARKLWKRILDPTTAADANAILAQLKTDFPTVADRIRLDDRTPKALKDLEKGAALLRRNGSEAYKAETAMSWTRESVIISALDQADKRFVRIYFDDTDQDDIGQATAKRIREAALGLAFDEARRAYATP